MRRTRRRLLGTLGGTVGSVALAGCLTDVTGPADDTPDETPTATPIEPPTDTDEVTVRRVRVLPEVVTRSGPDAYGVFGGKGSQYVVATVDVATPAAHPESAFAVETPDDSFDVTTEVGNGLEFLAGVGRAYEQGERDTGWLAARLPNPVEAETAALTWNGGRHRFDTDLLEALRREPTTFDVTLSGPYAATVSRPVSVAVRVENTGDVDGTFVGALNRSGPRIAHAPVTEVEVPVAAGETARWSFEYQLDRADIPAEEETMVFYLRWRGNRRTSHDVIVRPDGSPTPPP